MRFQTECFENVEAFGETAPPMWTDAHGDLFHKAPLRRVMNLVVEAASSDLAPDEAFTIANAPWEPTDMEGATWDHAQLRSMSSGDVVLVHTPDGAVAFGCTSWGWLRLPTLPLSVVAALAG